MANINFANPNPDPILGPNDPRLAAYLAAYGGDNSVTQPFMNATGAIDPTLFRGTTPFIGAVAKAYQNDPRTQLATKAMDQGASTDPVARGKYGVADGIARALTGVAGGWINRQQEDRYNKIQAATAAQAAGRPSVVAPPPITAADTISAPSSPALPSTPPTATPPNVPPTATPPNVPPGVSSSTGGIDPMLASAITSQLGIAPGSPPAPSGAPSGGTAGMPGLPMAQIPPTPSGPPPGAAGAGASPSPTVPPASMPGGSSQSTLPFAQDGQGTQVSDGTKIPAVTPANVKAGAFDKPVKGTGDPTQIPQMGVPDMPALPEQPTAPDVVPARQSTLLNAAYRMLGTGNPVTYDTGIAMLQKGLEEQDTLNAAFDDRAQQAADEQFKSKSEIYATAYGANRTAQLNYRQSLVDANVKAYQANAQNAFQAKQDALTRATSVQTANIGAGATLGAARIGAQSAKDVANINYQKALDVATAAAKIKRNSYLTNTPQGQAMAKSNTVAARVLGTALDYRNNLNAPGPHPGGFGQGVLGFNNPQTQHLYGLSKSLVTDLTLLNTIGGGGRSGGTNMQSKNIEASKPSPDVSAAEQRLRVNKIISDNQYQLTHNNMILEGLENQRDPVAVENEFQKYVNDTRNLRNRDGTPAVDKNGDPLTMTLQQWRALQ